MPVALVKSLSSSTKALAGSHAAQHNVRDFPSAGADDPATRINASIPAAHARDRFVLLILIVAPPILAGHCWPLLNSRVGRDFKALLVWARPQTFSSSRGSKHVNCNFSLPFKRRPVGPASDLSGRVSWKLAALDFIRCQFLAGRYNRAKKRNGLAP